MSKFKKNWIFYIIAFMTPVLIFLLAHIIRGIYPFGEGSILVLDLNAQYVYYYEAFRNIFYSGGSLFYSFSRTLGGEMMGIWAYYVASPFSVILLLFPKEMITESVFIMILCKIGCSGLSFYYYINKTRGGKKIYGIIFSSLYALSAYVIIQSMNPMWLDAVLFFPLIILGLERLVKEGKTVGYIFFLAITLIANFYIGYMVGIFLVVYFVYYIILNWNKESVKSKIFIRIIQFAYSSVISVALSLWLIIPTYFSLKMGKFTFTDPDFFPMQKLDLLDVFSKLLPLSYDSINYPGLPFIYCGTISLILVGLYFLNKNIKNREKIGSLVLISVLITSFTVSTLDLFLHGFQAPNWLNYRYSFILTFILARIAYDAFTNIKKSSNRDIFSVSLALVFLTLIVSKNSYENFFLELVVWTSYGLLFIYSLLLYFVKKPKSSYGKFLVTLLLCLIIFVELLANSTALIFNANSEVLFSDRASYREYFDKLDNSVDYIKKTDEGFYRSETAQHRTVNDPMELGLYGLSNSSSLLNTDVINFLYNLGVCSREHWSKYKGTTPITDSIFGFKYIISENEVNSLYNEVYKDDELTVYENPYALPIAFPVNAVYKDIILDSTDPFANQNMLLSTLIGDTYTPFFNLLEITEVDIVNLNSVFVNEEHISYQSIITGQNAHIEYTIKNEIGHENYMFLYSKFPRPSNVLIDKEFVDTFFEYESTCILPLGRNENDEITVTVTPTDGDVCIKENYFYSLDNELLAEAVEKINSLDIEINKLSERKIDISTYARKDQVMFTSIPYEKGWTVIVNGRQVETFKAVEALLSFELDEGENDILMTFTPQGFVLGLGISICALIFFIMLLIIANIKSENKGKNMKEIIKK